ncbi:MAG: cupin domain-containing protein [Anaerolineae bacterium]|nr:cupin domain-containing protein [Anaerolineae bacterium]
MPILKHGEVTHELLNEKSSRFIAQTDNMMMVVVAFADGPQAEPDPPHSHPHEQITYVAEGELLFFLDGKPTTVGPGDVVVVPPNTPHTIQRLSECVQLVDTFHPPREDFLKK